MHYKSQQLVEPTAPIYLIILSIMPKFPASSDKERLLVKEMEALGISEDDLIEKFIKGSGPGGQKINKTSSCVYLQHIPTQTEIKCQRTRSQSLNRYYARKELIEALKEQIDGEKSKKQQAIEKIRRQKRKRSKRAKEKVLQEKKHRSSVKTTRKPVGNEE